MQQQLRQLCLHRKAYSKMIRVLLGLGSNKCFNGKNPPELLGGAVERLSKVLVNAKFSSVYKTRAMYVEDQDDFYNMAAVGFVPDETTPENLLKTTQKIEAEFGRDRSKEIRFGPRPLDIDIELFGNDKTDTPNLQIPHPRVKERAFVLVPAIEILDESSDKTIRDEFSSALALLDTAEIEKLGSLDSLLGEKSGVILKSQAVRNGTESDKC